MTILHEIQEHLKSKPPGLAVLAALNQLLLNDAHLLISDANERSISHRFGMYLQAELPGFHVDCEYNRTGIDPKRLDNLYLETDIRDTEGKTVFPDVIAHIRGTVQNYLVVEFKKKKGNVAVDCSFDFKKLRGYMGDARLNYEYALYIELAVDGRADIFRAEWVDS